MTTLLDQRTSQNASYANSISIPLTVANEAQLVGQIGLDVTGSGSLLRAQLDGIAALQLPVEPVATTITVTIVRGTLSTDTLVFSANEDLDLAITGPQVLTITASDYDVPVPVSGELTYTMFVSSSVGGATRVGPESLNGSAYSE